MNIRIALILVDTLSLTGGPNIDLPFSFSHVFPSYATGHLHEKPLLSSTHVPLFLHGLLKQ